MADPTLYLFDGFNVLHAGGFGSPEELRDLLASWVAAQGARGILVFGDSGRVEHRGKKLLRDGRIASSPGIEGKEQTPPVAYRAQIVSAAQFGSDLVGQLQRLLASARLT